MDSRPAQLPQARSPGRWSYLLIGLALVVGAGLMELAMGRTPISKSGAVRLWVSETDGAETSQQVADWYSFTHITHGILLYGLFRMLGRGRWPAARCVLMALSAEAAWEILENSDVIINRYRAATISNGYYGDSILNSVCDMLCCVAGSLVARYMPVRASLAVVAVLEVGLALAIRDNLALNVIMLIHPFDAIKHWQMGAG